MIEPPSIPPTYHPFLTTTHGDLVDFTAFGAFLLAFPVFLTTPMKVLMRAQNRCTARLA